MGFVHHAPLAAQAVRLMQAYLSARAKARGVEVGQLVNQLLKKDIELIQAARQSLQKQQRPRTAGVGWTP